ncbi:MFS transporter [Novosphingobium lentum]|uniref:MFS transporter n=1 Tax=Novosphingobium lentum TaxID=145287 RepID=UPI000832B0CE|nr:MFS transporter [Novosphingobium lentum]
MPPAEAGTAGTTKSPRIEGYSWYALGLLVLVYVLNFIDRQLLTILAPDVKRDLHINDTQFGFLYGTAFGVFYALFGIPLGKLADRWVRVRLLALGLALWSAMTVLSGLSRNFGQLGAARIGVGIGEATAGPTGYSLISDYFPPRKRATAIAIYSAGIYLGGGLSLTLGTGIAKGWNAAFPPGSAPLGLAGWQAAFLAIGLPGLLLALWVRTLREPVRGRHDAGPTDGVNGAAPSDAARVVPGVDLWLGFVADLGDIVPPFTLVAAMRRGQAALRANLAVAALVALAAFGLARLIGDPLQWTALGIGAYAVASWRLAVKERDPPVYAAIWGSRSMLGVTVGYGLIAFIAYANAAFGPLYAIERFHADVSEVALLVGGSGALGGATGVIAGGAMADFAGRGGSNARRVAVIAIALLLALVPAAILLLTGSKVVFYATVFPSWFLFSAALGASSGTIVNIVPANARGTATATFLIGATMIGLALGPYTAGKVSTVTGSLRNGLAATLLVVPPALIALAIAWRDLRRRETVVTAC